MNIVISHVYSNNNKGDAALLSVLLTDIKKTFKNPRITILTLDKVKKGELFEGVPIELSFMHHVSDRYKYSLAQMLYGFVTAVITIVWAVVYRLTKKNIPLPRHLKKITDIYTHADLIIPVGGGYIRAKSGFRETAILFFILHSLIFSYILGKTTVNYAQSIGPFGNSFQEWMTRFTLKRVDGIIARESITLHLLNSWGITKNTILSVDSGFLFQSNVKKNIHQELGISSEKKIIGVTTRNWLTPKKQETYEQSIAEFSDYCIKKYDATIVFIPQVTVENHQDDDRESNKRAFERMQYKNKAYLIEKKYDHQTIKALYGSLDYLIGTRFHSVIFALTSYVPSIAVEYEYKTRGIMTDLGLEAWVISMQDVHTQTLITLFESLMKEKNHYINQLKTVLPAYIEKAKSGIHFVKKRYKKTNEK